MTWQKCITYGGVIKRPMRPVNNYPFGTKIISHNYLTIYGSCNLLTIYCHITVNFSRHQMMKVRKRKTMQNTKMRRKERKISKTPVSFIQPNVTVSHNQVEFLSPIHWCLQVSMLFGGYGCRMMKLNINKPKTGW